MDGITGPVKFNENGERREIEFEILNLRNNTFKKVSFKVCYIHLFVRTVTSEIVPCA